MRDQPKRPDISIELHKSLYDKFIGLVDGHTTTRNRIKQVARKFNVDKMIVAAVIQYENEMSLY